jgi:hypothetical protein
MAQQHTAGTDLTITWTVSVAGVLTNPTDMVLTYQFVSAAGVASTAVVLRQSSSTVTRVSTGSFKVVISTTAWTAGGTLVIQAQATGAVVAVTAPGWAIDVIAPALPLV